MFVTAPADYYLPAIGAPVKRGETIEVDDEVGAQLVEQGWLDPAVMRRDDLFELATEAGLDLPKKATKGQIIDALEEVSRASELVDEGQAEPGADSDDIDPAGDGSSTED